MTKEQAEALAREIEEDYEQPFSVAGVYENAVGDWRVMIVDRPLVVRSEREWNELRRWWFLGREVA